MTNASMDMGGGGSLISVCRNGTGKITMGISIEIPQKAKTRSTYDTFSWILQRLYKYYYRDTCLPILIVVLSTTVRKWKQPGF